MCNHPSPADVMDTRVFPAPQCFFFRPSPSRRRRHPLSERSAAAPVRTLDLLAIVILTGAAIYGVRYAVGEPTLTPLTLIALMLLTALIPLGAVWLVVVRRRGVSWRDLGLRPASPAALVGGAVLGALTVPLAGAINLLVDRVTPETFENPQITALAPTTLSAVTMIGMFVIAAVVAPLVEEVVFRGVLYGWMRRSLRPAIAAVLSGVIFASVHGVPQLVPALAVQGIILALVYERTGSLWPSVVLHGVFNGIMLAMLYALLLGGGLAPPA